MTPTTTTTSIRDWLIDCAVRWQRRNKLLVPRANATPGAEEVSAVIGSRNALRAQPIELDDAEAVESAIVETAAEVEAPIEEIVAEVVASPAEPQTVEAAEPVAVEEVVEIAEPVAEVEVAETVEAPEAIAPQPAPEPGHEVSAAQAEAVETTEPEAVEVAAEVLEVTVPSTTPEAVAAAEAPAAEAAAPSRRAADRREPASPPLEMATLVVPASNAPSSAVLDLEKMKAWDVLVLAGPAGSGKSSIAHHFCSLLPKAVHIKVEPLRDRTYSVLVARPFGDGQPEVWSGTTEEARQHAVALATAYMQTGNYVVVDDVIEAPTELTTYVEGFAEKATHVVTLMPSLDEMERRDRMVDVNQSSATRVRELHAGMIRQMGQHSSLFDTSHETIVETVQRIIGLLEV